MLEHLLNDRDPQPTVVAISEHWLKQKEEDYCDLLNYKVLVSRSQNFLRKGRVYGGVLLYAKENVNCKRVDSVSSFAVDLVCEVVGLRLLDHGILVLCVYRTPNKDNFLKFCEIFENILKKYGLNNKVCICGDFNIHFNEYKPRI